MPGSDTITLVTVTDNHYLIMLAALVKSIEANLGGQSSVDLWVVDDGLTEQNKTKLERSVNPGVTNIYWKKLGK
jgi:lipopolysaccharide biosynthesis glycosyltransferase